MDSLKVLHSKAAKIVLNRPTHSSFTQALIDLGWVNLQWIFGFDGAYIDLSIFFFFCCKAQLRSSYFSFKEWNEIPLKVSNSERIGSFISLKYNFR